MQDTTLEKTSVRFYPDDEPGEQWEVSFSYKGHGFRAGGGGGVATFKEAMREVDRLHIIHATPKRAAAILAAAHARHIDLASTYDLTDDDLRDLVVKAARAELSR